MHVVVGTQREHNFRMNISRFEPVVEKVVDGPEYCGERMCGRDDLEMSVAVTP